MMVLGSVLISFNFYSWNSFRSNQAIEKVLGDGLAWVDAQGETKTYWFPSLFPGRSIQQQ